jgi:cobalt-precorrin 5A hydrolase
MIVAGIGCRTGCDAIAILAVVRAAERQAGRKADRLAAPSFKAPQAEAAAALLRIPCSLVDPADLAAAQPSCVTRSARAQAAVGVASVAEGSALAAAGPGARLILPRIATPQATCALAETA